MNTVDIKGFVHKKAGAVFDPPLTHQDVHSLHNIYVDAISHCILHPPTDLPSGKEHTVNIRGFGKFILRKRKGRVYTVRGEEHTIGDRWTVTFKPGSDLKRALEDVPLR